MGEVKSAFEKAMEKMNTVEALTAEEKAELKDREEMKTLLAAFYKGKLSRDQMWQKFKGIRPALLKEAQHSMADSLRLGITAEEFRQRKEGILAIEALKDKKNTSAVESTINAIDRLQKEHIQIKEHAAKELRAAVEQNPQLRMRPVRTPDGRTAYQAALSVDEAVQAKMSEFLAEHEKRYELMFSQAVAKLNNELR
jgi:hypothetical protein